MPLYGFQLRTGRNAQYIAGEPCKGEHCTAEPYAVCAHGMAYVGTLRVEHLCFMARVLPGMCGPVEPAVVGADVMQDVNHIAVSQPQCARNAGADVNAPVAAEPQVMAAGAPQQTFNHCAVS